ncbi:MAG: hypothetical protein K0R19_3279 [Bacillota bacterium]|jgi:hypothetical protein|nr:hypothetical protein [Bacillota bacterium]
MEQTKKSYILWEKASPLKLVDTEIDRCFIVTLKKENPYD